MTARGFSTLLLCALPALAQYSGPAILSRGEAPAAMSAPQVRFQPFLSIGATYNTGLATVGGTNAQGQLATSSSAGATLQWGVSGLHSWKHTRLGMSYSGNMNHFVDRSYYDALNQSLLLGLSHTFSSRVSFTLNESASIFSRQFGLQGLSNTVPFDPSTTYSPVTDYFDNRTLSTSTNGALTLQKTLRLSFRIGGHYFVAKRRSAALDSNTGQGANGDVQYRLTSRTTVGATYTYSQYSFSQVGGGTDVHTAAGSYAVRLTRWTELSAYAGVARAESKFTETAPVDPAISSLLGIASVSQIVHSVTNLPYWGTRLSRTFYRGVAYVSAGHGVTPGNGLFLTSYATNVTGGYTYTGLRRWSFAIQSAYWKSTAVGQISGDYANASAGLRLSRTITHALHFYTTYSARQYSSGSYGRYNRLIYDAQVGVSFSPGEIPVRLW